MNIKPQSFSPSFLIIPKILYKDKDLQLVDMMVYGVVYWYEHLRNSYCTASNNSIAQVINVDPRSVQNSLTRLESKGYIIRFYVDKKTKRNRKEIRTLVDFDVRKIDDRRSTSERQVILERKLDDRHERKLDDQSIEYSIKNRSIYTFEQFWTLYPKKKDRANSEKKWAKLSEEKRKAILEDLPKRSLSSQWQKDNGQFIPYPTTYLNGERWNDEIENYQVYKNDRKVDVFSK